MYAKSMDPNPGGFGSSLSRNISPNTTKVFTNVLTYMSSNRYITDISVDGMLHCRSSYAHTLLSAI